MPDYEGKPFIERNIKASWGVPCNQSADGNLWTGKGYALTLESQFGAPAAADLARALEKARGRRCGRFWINVAARTVVMAVGAAEDNSYQKAPY